jgi:hypothetical protein
MGSAIRRLAFLWTLGAGGALLFTIILASSDVNFLSALVLTRLAVIWLAFLIYSLIVYSSLSTKGSVASADDYVSHIYNSQTEYCLILRPFGADGFIPIRVNPPKDKLSRILMRIFGLGVWKMSKTVEQIIGETVNNVLNCETVALVDPKLKLVPSSPKFISTDNSSWQRVIELLLKRSLAVFLILPPGKGITCSVLWEVERIARWGLVGRFVIVLPPPDHSGYRNSYESVKELADLFPAIHRLPDKVILISPYSNVWADCWKAEPKKREKTGEFTYVSGLNHILTRIKSEMSECPLPQRYLYSWGNGGTSSIRKEAPPRASDLKPVDDDDDHWPSIIQ